MDFTNTASASIAAGCRALVARLAPRLALEEPLESQFRDWYSEHRRARVRITMWLAMGTLLTLMLAGGPLHDMRQRVFGHENQAAVDLLRFGFVVPGCTAMLLVSYTSLYRRWFSLIAQILAILCAVSFVAMDALMHSRGYSLSAWMPLLVLAPYFLYGMFPRQAIRTALITLAAFVAGGALAGLNGPQRYFDIFAVAFAMVIGGAMHYALQKSARQSFLANQVLSESAHRDSLTGLHNRRKFDEHMQRLWEQATRERVALGLLLLDLDHFKAFNDHSGHQAGDACLVKVAATLPGAARPPLDLAARYGGEEFAVLLYDAQRDKMEELCRQLHQNLRHAALAHPASPISELVTFSIGAACVQPLPGRHPEGFIQLADEALYAAKEHGRNRSVIMDREYETLTTGQFRVPRTCGKAA